MTQAAQIVDYMQTHGSITTMQAFDLGITRLASRVHELRQGGIDVQREMVRVLNRHGETCHVARYTLPAEVEQ